MSWVSATNAAIAAKQDSAMYGFASVHPAVPIRTAVVTQATITIDEKKQAISGFMP